jgi:hypothetical protein
VQVARSRPPCPVLRVSPATSSAGGPGNERELLHLIPRCDRDSFRPEARNLPAADRSQLGGADDSVGGYDPEPGKSFRFLARKCREYESYLAGRDLQVLSDRPVGGYPAFRDCGYYRQDPRLESQRST